MPHVHPSAVIVKVHRAVQMVSTTGRAVQCSWAQPKRAIGRQPKRKSQYAVLTTVLMSISGRGLLPSSGGGGPPPACCRRAASITPTVASMMPAIA